MAIPGNESQLSGLLLLCGPVSSWLGHLVLFSFGDVSKAYKIQDLLSRWAASWHLEHLGKKPSYSVGETAWREMYIGIMYPVIDIIILMNINYNYKFHKLFYKVNMQPENTFQIKKQNITSIVQAPFMSCKITPLAKTNYHEFLILWVCNRSLWNKWSHLAHTTPFMEMFYGFCGILFILYNASFLTLSYSFSYFILHVTFQLTYITYYIIQYNILYRSTMC